MGLPEDELNTGMVDIWATRGHNVTLIDGTGFSLPIATVSERVEVNIEVSPAAKPLLSQQSVTNPVVMY